MVSSTKRVEAWDSPPEGGSAIKVAWGCPEVPDKKNEQNPAPVGIWHATSVYSLKGESVEGYSPLSIAQHDLTVTPGLGSMDLLVLPAGSVLLTRLVPGGSGFTLRHILLSSPVAPFKRLNSRRAPEKDQHHIVGSPPQRMECK